MTYLSIMEKFKILFNLFMDFKSILALMIIILILTLLYIIKKIDTKKYTLAMIGSFILVFAISIISNYKILSNTFDNFADIFFTNIYFPSIYVYIATLVICLVSFITSILNIMMKRIYKVINTIIFILNNILLIVILNIIAKNKIDIFSVSSLYTNTNLVAILELSMGLFVLWILSLVIVYATNSIFDRIKFRNKQIVNTAAIEVSIPTAIEEEYTSNNEIVSELPAEEIIEPAIVFEENPNTIVIENNEEVSNEEEIPTEEVIESNMIIEETPNTIVIEDNKEISEEENKITFNDILNGRIPVMYYENETVTNSYNIINPQEIYEKRYSENRKFQDIIEEIEPIINEEDNVEEQIEEISEVIEETSINQEEINNTIIEPISSEIITNENDIIEEVDEKTISNTISLDLLEEKEEKLVEDSNDEYTVNDYKKMIKMLNSLKNQSNKSNISIDDAVTLSLISNYSIEDCIKLKDLLESNIN